VRPVIPVGEEGGRGEGGREGCEEQINDKRSRWVAPSLPPSLPPYLPLAIAPVLLLQHTFVRPILPLGVRRVLGVHHLEGREEEREGGREGGREGSAFRLM